ncbi:MULTISPECIES: aminoacyl-tRNA hydrolase [unclassified Oceanobacter]|uniref:aminoacyl-tRNA hydrolase n=1 Tax=unclassified Oceanobacter TaxID=2620260 RepID=UPI0026E2235D|nr:MULTISPECIES: aminoacyl-tRNA hydrolase [unclassified Oceanobacter]MDO6682242.1 aminoacyl-tRNA hydrolase [Oceanobacter sp. 5_MG-2023]MDP2506325.1 aminoacyl-tRNA hydrolase [Oceanobacter sp. 3_MG-2023]MDP2546414.1 aminoacyl-tRNA hydrolase [Oceanobacter sp. 4_MG-2023]MDP2609985.1 aminoacyl-tRNA hydrolase [Oceanobacter sp. 1_MG-2023]MDP2613255.1 aminoacyl-tRNA hydrolase [Oceanobacter sp. 2_MG-2023]
MTAPISLIVGLGNPGSEYEHTRHNAGFWCLDAIARSHGITLSADKKFHGLAGKGRINGHECWLLKPTTFMNRSGLATAALANFYKLKADNILVIHDELDLPPGVARFKTGGGHGGQNGLRDIISQLGNNKDFHRLRIGIGHPGDKSRVTGHVLGRAPIAEEKSIRAAIDEAIQVLPDALNGEMAKAMNRLHSFKG